LVCHLNKAVLNSLNQVSNPIPTLIKLSTTLKLHCISVKNLNTEAILKLAQFLSYKDARCMNKQIFKIDGGKATAKI